MAGSPDRNMSDRTNRPALARIFADQRPVAGIDRVVDRGLVMGQVS